jgi:hypothetical protein
MAQEQNTTPENTIVTPKRGLDASVSFIASSVLLIIALIVGGMYMMGGNMGVTKDNAPVVSVPPVEKSEDSAVAATEALQKQGNSDELGDIEADLNATNLESLDGVNQIQ